MAKVHTIGGGPVSGRLLPPQKLKIDELGEIKRRLKLMKPDEDRARVLEEEIKGWFEGDAPNLPVQVAGDQYELYMSPKRSERTVTDKKKAFNALKKALGLDGLIAVLEFPVGILDRNVPASLQKGFVHQERSGYRTMDVVALHPANDSYQEAA